MAIVNRFNRGKPIRPGAKPNPRAAKMCDDWVKARGGNASFDSLYRMLVEAGFPPNDAHLALEDFMRGNMMKRVKKPTP